MGSGGSWLVLLLSAHFYAMGLQLTDQKVLSFFFDQSSTSDQLLESILNRADDATLLETSQVSWQWRNITEKVSLGNSYRRLLRSKQELFSLIKAVTEAKPNIIQYARDWLASSEAGTSVDSQLLEKLKTILVQPESLLITLESYLQELLESPSLACKALKRLNKAIEDIKVLRAQSGDGCKLNGVLYDVQLCYQSYRDSFTDQALKRRELIQPKVILSGERFFGNEAASCSYRISQEKALKMLSQDEFGFLEKENKDGSHPVSFMQLGKKNRGVHFKEGSRTITGLQAGKESAMYWLSQVLFQNGAAPTALVTLNSVKTLSIDEKSPLHEAFCTARSEGKSIEDFFADHLGAEKECKQYYGSHVLQAGYHIAGISLEKFIDGVEQRKYCFEDLDLASFSEQIILSILTNPSDNKPDNFIVTVDKKPYKIVCVDNDMAFENPLIPITSYDNKTKQTKKEHNVAVRNALYCLPLMDEPIDEKIVNRFLHSSPEATCLQWLLLLLKDEKGYEKLREARCIYNDSTPLPYLQPTHYKNILELPLMLSSAIIDTFERTFLELKNLMLSDLIPTHRQLCLKAQPLVARFYEAIQNNYQNESLLEVYRRIDTRYGQKKYNDLFLEDVLSDYSRDTLDKNLTVGQAVIRLQQVKTAPSKKCIAEMIQKMVSTVDPLMLDKPAPFLHLMVKLLQDNVFKKVINDLNMLHEGWRNERLLIKALLHRCTTDVIDFLIDKLCLDPSILDTEGNTLGWSTLSHAVARCYDPSMLSKLSSYYKKKHGQCKLQQWYNHKSDDSYTVLDHSFLQKKQKHTACLINLGCTACSPRLARSFYQETVCNAENEDLYRTFAKLAHNNALVKWQLCLDFLLPVCKDQKNGPYQLQTLGGGMRAVPKNQIDQALRDKAQEIFISGQQQVGNEKNPELKHELTIKLNPQYPGIEAAVRLLSQKIVFFGAPIEFAKLTLENETHAVLLSDSDDTCRSTFADKLKRDPSILYKFDEENISANIIFVMLINPEHGGPYDYNVQEIAPDKYCLRAIKNGLAFMPAIVLETHRPLLQGKKILFCLDQMNKKVDSSVRQRLLDIHPYTFLKEWLNELIHLNNDYLKLFNSKRERTLLYSKKNCYIGIPITEDQVERLYKKCIALQNALEKNAAINHIELLAIIEPLLAKTYQKVLLKKEISPLERLNLIDQSFCEELTGESLIKDLPAKMKLNQFLLGSGQENLKCGLNKLEEISKKRIEKEEASYVMLYTEKPNKKKRKEFVNLLQKDELQILSLADEAALTDDKFADTFFSDRWAKKNTLVCVNLSGCQKVTFKTLQVLALCAKNLRELNLAKITTLKKIYDKNRMGKCPLVFCSLQALDVSCCNKLVTLLLQAINLRMLNLENCIQLSDTMLDGVIKESPYLSQLFLKGAKKINQEKIAILENGTHIF